MAETKELSEVLADLPVFHGMDENALEYIADCAGNVRFEVGQTIFREGDAANYFYVIRHGKVSVELHAPQRGATTIEILQDGDVLGWSWLFPPHKTKFDARCLALTRALAFDAACLRGKCEEDQTLGYDLMKRFAQIMTQRIRATRLQLLEVYSVTPKV